MTDQTRAVVTLKEVLGLIVRHYATRGDGFILSLGHNALPLPSEPMSITNLPEFNPYLALTMREIRFWEKSL